MGGRQLGHLVPCDARDRRDDHLRDPLSARDGERYLAPVDQDDAHLATVIGVDGPGAVHHPDAVPRGQPAAGADLRFTKKGETLYAIFLDWPEGESAIQALGGTALPDGVIERVDLLGGPQLQFRRDADALRLTVPPPESGAFVPALRISGRGLV